MGQDVQDNDRGHGDQRPGHHGADDVIIGAIKIAQPHRDHPVIFILGQNQGKDKLVPDIVEDKDRSGDNARDRERDDDVPQRLQAGAAVDQGRLFDLS